MKTFDDIPDKHMPLEDAVNEAEALGVDRVEARSLLLEKVRKGKILGYAINQVPWIAPKEKFYGENNNG